ncbi:Ser/Thr-rich protein T10 in DGCR region, putative isoform 1 [Hibiscus syriacus]|uniref:Ser/Thr-rich protein T10 in DGCR region, putative isoform 1 n=1 Tax=Hibiscus syriacus TaxID=106335 RepID=A0A6A2YA85_HIBSY|nr:Ser/Thr-rich protein T10 in DGCR region, putative isoform 1 [Hibiscus syriacus]
MGKVVEKKRKKKKKKGRPSLLDLQKRNLKEQQQSQQDTKRNYSTPKTTLNYDSATATPPRRSTRRHPNHSSGDNDDDGQDNASDEEEEQDEEEEEELTGKKRREKKMKLVLKLPSSQQKSPVNSESLGSDSNLEDSNAGSTHRKRKINSIGDGSATADSRKEEKSVSGANLTRSSQGGQLDSGPSTALPDKKLLLFILDRLQKKDTYGVFSEPVDPEELPDYHEVIEHPMDFGTIRKKLATGAYAILEQFEKDVFLICSNAMQYNAPDTIYFRQARSIQELAKKNFDNLRQDSDDNEAEPKVIRRGRPPTKNFMKTPGRPSLEHNASEFSSDATLATGPENTLCSNHDMRKGPLASDKSNIAGSSGSFYGSRNDVYSGSFTENRSNRNDEGYMVKNGKKNFVLDENRRNTYNLFHSSAAREASVLNTFAGERKQLLTVCIISINDSLLILLIRILKLLTAISYVRKYFLLNPFAGVACVGNLRLSCVCLISCFFIWSRWGYTWNMVTHAV